MKNIETPDKMHLWKLIGELRDGQYVIPDFQREFEWNAGDVVELIKSIFEDYYIGTLLFWKAGKDNLKTLKCEPIYGFVDNHKPSHIILDGQQRLSALYYAFFAPNIKYPNRKSRCFFFVDLAKLLEENYDVSFHYEWDTKNVKDLLGNKTEQFKKKIFPLSVFGDKKTHAWIKWLEEYEKYWKDIIGEDKAIKERDAIESIFEDIINNYDVSFIELDRDIEISKVCDIFTRINTAGIELTIFDLLNATLRPKEIFLKKMWRDVKENFNTIESEKMKVYLLQTMSILKQGYCAPKFLYYLVPNAKKPIKQKDGSKKKIVLISSKEEFTNLWDFVVKNVNKTINKIQNPRDLGAIKSKFIPYPSLIPILTAIDIEKDDDENKDIYIDRKAIEEKIRKWYWSSIFTRNYSSAVESQMAKDFVELKKWFIDDPSIPEVVVQMFNEIDALDLHREASYGSAIYKGIFSLIVLNGAKDWESFQLPEYVNLEDHHIVPRSWGEKRVGKNIHSILNRTALSDKTNENIIGNQMPNVYFKKIFKKAKNQDDVYKLMESHLISKKAVEILMRKDFDEKDYHEFIEERRKTILNEIKSRLGIENLKQMQLITPDTPFTNKLQLENTIKKCSDFIYWIDKYFTKVGLRILISSLENAPENNIKHIKILTNVDKVDSDFRKDFKDFKKQVEKMGIEAQLRVISVNKIRSDIHDRWIVSYDINFNLPSIETILRGQYSEIKETKNKPPFEKWWDESLDIISDWNKIQEISTKK